MTLPDPYATVPCAPASPIATPPIKPPFAYFGGKTRLASRIVELLPEHGHYVEPFAGSLAVLLSKPISPLETVNDLDGDLVHFWRILRDRPDELVRAAALTPHSRAEHQNAYEPTADPMERARRTWVLLSQGRSGQLRRTGWRYFANPGGTNNSMPDYLRAYADRMEQAAERLHHVSLECRPALDVIANYGQHPSTCLYVDPPYEGVTRPKTYDGYRHEMRATADHEALLTTLLACNASVVLSGYHSDLYDDLLEGWDRVEIPASTQRGGADAARLEVVWCNRPLHHGRLDLFGGAA